MVLPSTRTRGRDGVWLLSSFLDAFQHRRLGALVERSRDVQNFRMRIYVSVNKGGGMKSRRLHCSSAHAKRACVYFGGSSLEFITVECVDSSPYAHAFTVFL